ncbi:Vacuolar protease A [Mycoblastus sanguinarius]|nr:Vacuolar protease A [Mycoblastus sanguinarius]
MRALIDINWADMIIPSVNCTNCDHRLKYNSSRSSTYEANGTELLLDWNYTFGKGFVSVDTITVGDGVRIPHHPFLEASQSSVGPFGEEDTILGLAIDKPLYEFPDRPSQHKLPSPFATMAEKGNLDRNVVALLLPKGDRDLGDIMFGDLDSDLYEGELSTHPLYPEGTTNWQIEANSAQVVDQDGTIIFEEHFPGFIAQLHTSFPYTVLPPAIGFAILDATGADGSNDCHGFEVPCNKLSELPHVRFNLGGHNITLTGEDYAVETDVTWPFCAHSVYCTMLIAPGHPDIYEEKRIELGSSFLKGVYSAYDLDSKSVYRRCRVLFCR